MKEREALEKIISKLVDMEYYIISVDYAITQLYEYNVRDDNAFSKIDDIRRLYNEILDEIKSVESLKEIYNEVIKQRREELIKALKEITERLPRATINTTLTLELLKVIERAMKKCESHQQ